MHHHRISLKYYVGHHSILKLFKTVFLKHGFLLLYSNLRDGNKPTCAAKVFLHSYITKGTRVGKVSHEPQITHHAETMLRAGSVSHLCQTYTTLRDGVLPSKMYCLPPTASATPASEASANTTGLVPRYLQLWGTQHPSSEPYIPALHFPRLFVSSIIRYCSGFLLYHAINSICLTKTYDMSQQQRDLIIKPANETAFLNFNGYSNNNLKISGIQEYLFSCCQGIQSTLKISDYLIGYTMGTTFQRNKYYL